MKLGFSRKEIVLDVNGDMTGFIYRGDTPRGINDPLYVSALAIDHILIISCDLLGLEESFTNSMADKVAEACHIECGDVHIWCTHTHSGPASIFLQDCGTVDPVFTELLAENIISAATDAVNSMADGNLFLSRGTLKINTNRVYRDNHIEGADDFVDSELWCLRAETLAGNIVLINYSCHPIFMGGGNTQYSRDYVFYAESELRQRGVADYLMLATGCSGDINPREMRADNVAAKQYGHLAGQVIADTLECEKKLDVGAVSSVSVPVTLEMAPMPTKKEILAYREDILSSYCEAVSKLDSSARALRAMVHWADRILEKWPLDGVPSWIKTKVSLIRIGSLCIAALPFEAFHGVGLSIKKLIDGPCMTVGYAGGDYGYLASDALFDLSIYEMKDSYRYYGYPAPLAKGSEARIVEAYNIVLKGR